MSGSPGRIRTYDLRVTCNPYVSIGHGLSHYHSIALGIGRLKVYSPSL